jgi:hypothetical protein
MLSQVNHGMLKLKKLDHLKNQRIELLEIVKQSSVLLIKSQILNYIDPFKV